MFFKRIRILEERVGHLEDRLAKAIDQTEQRIDQTEQRIDSVEQRIGHSEDRLVTVENVLSDQKYLLRSLVLMAEAGGPIKNMPLPYPGSAPDVPFTIGYSCNLLNNHYTYCSIARRKGLKAFLILDPRFQDLLITAFPVWEEAELELPPESSLKLTDVDIPKDWREPSWVRRVEWNLEHMARYDQMDLREARMLLESNGFVFDAFNAHESMRYFSASAHLELLNQFNQMDILQVSGTHIGVASYSQTPYVAFYYGADAYELPFQEGELGLMQVRGIKRANMHITLGRVREYLIAMGVPSQKIVSLPFMLDTDRYHPENEPPQALVEKYSSKKVILLGARQHWMQKGNDKIFRAIRLLSEKRDDFVCPTIWYGTDVKRSEALIQELGIERFITRCGLQSKKNLRNYFALAEVVVGQFASGLTGTYVLEAMGCGRPVVSFVDKKLYDSVDELYGGGYMTSPIVSAFTPEEIAEKLFYLLENDAERKTIGTASREWVEKYHGHEKLWPLYEEVYLRVLRDHDGVRY